MVGQVRARNRGDGFHFIGNPSNLSFPRKVLLRELFDLQIVVHLYVPVRVRFKQG
jgi:hypothetical protein